MGGGDRAYGECGHGEHEVAGERGVEADLGLVEPKLSLPNSKSSSTGQRRHATCTSVVRLIGRPSGM